MIQRFTATFTRPSNGTVYAAGDAVTSAAGDAIDFIGARVLNQGRIVSAKLSISNDSTTSPDFRLFFFRDDANLPTLTDNSAFGMTTSAEDDMIGYTDFTLERGGVAGAAAMLAFDANSGLNIPFTQKVTAGANQGIWGVLTATAAYNPQSPGTTVDVTIYVEQLNEER